MNRQQKLILTKFALVLLITVGLVVGMIEFKNLVRKSEAMRAMDNLGKIALQYRKNNGSIPPESYVDTIKKDLEGYVRMGRLQYRAQWIGFDAPPDEILAYVHADFHSLLSQDGYIVLRLDGRVEWMDKAKFEPMLAHQQTKAEVEIMRKK
jgi:hypothetical protein